MPLIKPYTGPRLPPDRYCLSAPNFKLAHKKKVSILNVTMSSHRYTVKFLNFGTPEIPKIQTRRQNLSVFCQKVANGIANSEDPDQTAPRGAV